jgi:hypothetical protein
MPPGAEALILLHLEELAVNDLREPFHHWVRTVALPVQNDGLGAALPHRPASGWAGGRSTQDPKDYARARELLDDLQPDLKALLAKRAIRLTDTLREHLQKAGAEATKTEEARYRSRQGEVSTLIAENTLQKLQREIGKLQAERAQGVLFDEGERLDRIDRSVEEKQAEIQRRRLHYDEVRGQLERERDRIIRYLLPKRYAMAAPAQVFPVTVEIRLPDGSR